jgi:hypothetical protein
MYRIELSPGEQTAFRSIEELAVAIRRGVVTPHARIWHNTSSKWLPIQFHPHYKIAASMQLTSAELVAGPPVKPLELLSLGELVDPPAPPVRPSPAPSVAPQPRPARRRESRPEPAPRPVAQPAPELRVAKPEPAPSPKTKRAKSRRSRSGRTLRIALAGSVLLAGIQVTYSAITSARSESIAARPRTHRRLVAEPASRVAQDSRETTTAGVMSGFPRARPSRTALSSRPGSTPALETSIQAATSPLGGSSAQGDGVIQAAPSGSEIAAAPAANVDSLAPRIVDSSGAKALNGVLRAITAPAASQAKRPKR